MASIRLPEIDAEGNFKSPDVVARLRETLGGTSGGTDVNQVLDLLGNDLVHQAFTPPVAQHTPMVSVLASTDSTLRATGTEVGFKRVGGTNAGSADIAGDPSFWFDGTPSMDPASDNRFVEPPWLPLGQSAGAFYAFAVETVTATTNTAIEFMVRAGTSFNFRAYVNGRPLTVARQSVTGLTSGGWYMIRLAFPGAASRRIRLVFGTRVAISAAYVAAGESLSRPNTDGARLAILGDSYEGGSGAAPTGGTRIETGGYLAAHALGARSIWNFGIGGTGYLNTTSTYGTRVDALLASNPDVVIVSGSGNDIGQDATALRAEIDDVLSRLSGVPEVYVTGPSQPTGYTAVNDIVKAAAAAAGRPFLDALGGDPWLDASLIGADGAHPTFQGHVRRANRIAEGVIGAREFVGLDVPAALTPGTETPTEPTDPGTGQVLWSDDFNRADADTLGTGWTTSGGTVGIRSNAAGVLSTTGGTAYAIRGGAADGVFKATVSVPGTGGPYLVARYATGVAADSLVVRRNTAGNWALQKRVSGTATYVHESTTPVAAGDKITLTLNGTTVALAVNGTQLWSGTISEHTANTLVGFGAWSSITDFRIDEMSFENLPA